MLSVYLLRKRKWGEKAEIVKEKYDDKGEDIISGCFINKKIKFADVDTQYHIRIKMQTFAHVIK